VGNQGMIWEELDRLRSEDQKIDHKGHKYVNIDLERQYPSKFSQPGVRKSFDMA
jgi:hypothetical protein